MISGQYDIAVAGGVGDDERRSPRAAARAGDYGPIYGPQVLGRYNIDRYDQGRGAR